MLRNRSRPRGREGKSSRRVPPGRNRRLRRLLKSATHEPRAGTTVGAEEMPRVHDIDGPYHVFFFSFDCGEPQHVHVRRDRMVCKFWLEPIELVTNSGFSPRELTKIRSLISTNFKKINEAWNDHCNQH